MNRTVCRRLFHKPCDLLFVARWTSEEIQERFMRTFTLIACLSVGFNTPLAAEPTPAQIKHFETHVRPVLVEHCQKCHGAEKQWGSLRLDSTAAMLTGGDSGPAVVIGNPEESRLILAIRQTDPDFSMPPKGKLTEKQIADLTQWVKDGAYYPEAKATSKPARDPNHWSFQPPQWPARPVVKNTKWVQSPLDEFTLAKMEAAGVTPSPQADKRTLLRRVTYDLIGLPPTPDEMTAFLADESPEAFARVVDRLLASPSYGERWGRHWLDVSRYADSNGLDENVAYGNAWRFRDYVVQSFNANKPYDRFVIEQLAGDLLPFANDAEHAEQLIATGFLSLGAKVLAEVDELKMEMDIVDEQIDTVGRAMLGLTLGCARCHDHKFDPIATADYYGLAGIFKSTRTMEHFRKVAKWSETPLPSEGTRSTLAAYQAQLAEKKQAIQQRVEQAKAAVKAALPAGEPVPDKLPAETQAALKTLRAELATLEKSTPDVPSAMSTSEDAVVDVAINIRGNPLKLGDVVARRVPPAVRGPQTPSFPTDRSGRLELARWMVDPQHALTSRVMVNRVWRWHFGTGLVKSVDNFGLLGETPSHPELLDWLALRFVNDGWSIKSLHRLIVLSNTYQISSHAEPVDREHDPENRWFARHTVRRLEAEAIRDALLSVSGQLDDAQQGSLLTVKNRAYFFDHTSKDLTDYSSTRRSVYLPVVRNNVYDFFQLLDYPDAAVPTGDRNTTTVAPQALLMMNSDFVATASQHLANRLMREIPQGDAERITRLYQLTYSREPSSQEVRMANDLLWDITTATEAAQAWTSLCHVILAANEFVYLQ